MKKKFKRSFWGYNPATVDDLLNNLDVGFKNKLMDLKKELADEVHNLELVKVEVNKLKDEVNVYKSLEDEISRILIGGYMEATGMIYETVKQTERSENSAAERVLERKAQLAELKDKINKMSEEICSTAMQYSFFLDKTEGER